MKLRIITILFTIVSGIPCFSQSEAPSLINDYIKAALEKRSTTAQLKALQNFDNAIALIFATIPYTTDSLSDVRSEAYEVLSITGKSSKQDDVRQKAVKQLIKGCKDKDSGISGKVLNALCQFNRNDFDSEATYELTMLAREKTTYYHLLIKLIGYINIADVKSDFRKMLEEKKYPNNQVRWALHLALARMGEADQVDYCTEKVKKLTVNDDMVYDVVPDLIYTCQKKAFDYLLGIIESDEKSCSSANPDSNTKMICAYRIMEQIAPYIENFPVETSASGDLNTKNYDDALLKVREWIKANRAHYIIRDQSF
jgi:hypothetical protein